MNTLYLFWLRNLKYAQISRLLAFAGSFDALFEDPSLIRAAKIGLRTATVDKLIETANRDQLLSMIHAAEKKDIRLISYDSDDYPDLLQKIFDPPTLLYTRGDLSRLSDKRFAVVGTRSGTRSGLMTARKISRELSEQGVSIISGMARGMDSAATVGAIEGKTPCAAVLGCGADIVYPGENRRMYEKIVETGVVISEYPPGTPPISSNFPSRNRIISGMSSGVLIVEGEMRSGAAITMRYAVEENREVFAIPGDLNSPFSVLPNTLISEGAVVTLNSQTILDHFGWKKEKNCEQTKKFIPKLDFSEQQLYTLLKRGDTDMDSLVIQTGWNVSEVSLILMRLELYGLVTRLPGNRFSAN